MAQNLTPDPEFDLEIREHIAAMPLTERQEAAKALGYIDGMPLTEDDLRMNIRQFRDMGTERTEALRNLAGPGDVASRRIGSLNPAEVAALFGEEWPTP